MLQPTATGEHKTKPTQHSVKELRGYGLNPDLVRMLFGFKREILESFPIRLSVDAQHQ